MTTTPARQPAGIRTGGQFATTYRDEARVDLTTPSDQLEVELEKLQGEREVAQERWRSGNDRGSARHDVEVLSMHVLARDALVQHPEATHLVLTYSDQDADEMLALTVRDRAGNTIVAPEQADWDPYDQGFEDSYTAASDLSHRGVWLDHAQQLDVERGDPEWALDLRAVIAQPVVLSGGRMPLSS